jgi:hypothetical protein
LIVEVNQQSHGGSLLAVGHVETIPVDLKVASSAVLKEVRGRRREEEEKGGRRRREGERRRKIFNKVMTDYFTLLAP